MTRFHLIITVFNPFFQGKLNTRGKIDSVWFSDYDFFMDKIIQGMDYSDLNKFRFNLFEFYKNQLSYIKVCQYDQGEILNGYCITSQEFKVPSCVIGACIPSRKLRDRYFEYDVLREKYFVKPDFINLLKLG